MTNLFIEEALLLEREYKKSFNDKNNKYMSLSFSCANSYRDGNDVEKAIKWYENTLETHDKSQEKYISCLNLYELYSSQKNIEKGLSFLEKSYEYDNTRVECFYYLIKHNCIMDRDAAAFSYYESIQHYYENDYINDDFKDKLLVCEEIYNFYLPYYLIIVSERLKKYDIGLKMFDIIFTKKNIDIGE